MMGVSATSFNAEAGDLLGRRMMVVALKHAGMIAWLREVLIF